MATDHQFPFPVSEFSWFTETTSDNMSYFAVSSYLSRNKNWATVCRWISDEKRIEECFSYELSFPPTHMTAEPINGQSLVFSGVDVTIARIQQDLKAIANLYSFQIPTENEIIPVTSHRCCISSAPKLYASGLNGQIYLWDIESAKLEQTIKTKHNICYDLDYCHAGPHLIVTVGFDGSIQFHDRRDPELVNREAYAGSGNPTIRVSWNKRNTNYISVMSLEDNNIIVYDVRNAINRSMFFTHHQAHVNSFCWSPYSSNSMYSSDTSGKCLYWSVNEGREKGKQLYSHSRCLEYANLQFLCPHPREFTAAVAIGKRVMISPIHEI